jgi:hypothetical protein
LDVFLDGGVDDLLDGTVVAEVDHFGPLGLKDATHDVDAGVVPVEETRRGDEAHRMPRHVQRV